MDTLKIDNIIVKNFSGHASGEENSYLKTWLDLSDANKRYYDHVVHVLETLKKEKEGEFEIPEIDGEWEKLKNTIYLKQRRRNLVFLRIAAFFVIILGTSFFFMYNSRPEEKKEVRQAGIQEKNQHNDSSHQETNEEPEQVSPQKIRKEEFNTKAEAREFFLADDSKIILEPNSDFVFKNQQATRRAYLNGSGIFHVKKDGKNFLLSTDALDIHVIGTIFEISESSNKKKIDIFVEEGQIEVVSRKDKSVKQTVSAGECYVYNVKQDKFHQKNTSRIKLKFSVLKSKFKNFFKKD